MKTLSIIAIVLLIVGLMAATTQAMAGPVSVSARNTGNPHGTDDPAETEMEAGHTPGAQATAHAGARQAADPARDDQRGGHVEHNADAG